MLNVLELQTRAMAAREILREKGENVDLLEKFFDPKMVEMLWHLYHGRAEIKLLDDLINLDKSEVPEGMELLPEEQQLERRFKGWWKFDQKKILFHTVELDLAGPVTHAGETKKGPFVSGKDIRNDLSIKNVSIFPSAVMDFMAKKGNERYFPQEWKVELLRIHFWTFFRDKGGDDRTISVPYITYNEERGIITGRTYLQYYPPHDEKRPVAVGSSVDFNTERPQYSGSENLLKNTN